MPRHLPALIVAPLLLLGCGDDRAAPTPRVDPPPFAPAVRFVDVTAAAGLSYTYKLAAYPLVGPESLIGGGVATGDYDRDGWVDLYVVRGDVEPNLLFRNRGDGTFEEVAAWAGVAIKGELGCGPTFADIDGDGFLDLFVGGTGGTGCRLFLNRGDGTFQDITKTCGLWPEADTFSAAFADYDRDGDLDVFVSHWGDRRPFRNKSTQHLWRNNGDRTFTDVSVESGITRAIFEDIDMSFTPNFADINGDGWPDLLLASDFGMSRVFLNQSGTFEDVTSEVISDENGMGAAIGDYDNDGDLDWFVSSIFDPNGVAEGGWGVTGNRLYRNRGDGTFEDATTEAGVREGYWGWGSSFGDFDNDGHLDLVHVNGFGTGQAYPFEDYFRDPTRLFMANGDGTFAERSVELGLIDDGQGRGVVCFDYDRDGDLDIFIANNREPPRLFRNDGVKGSYLSVELLDNNFKRVTIGARVYVTIEGKTQMRELRCGSNFVSQNSEFLHFGLRDAQVVDQVRVVWPDGTSQTVSAVAANQRLVIGRGR